MSGSPYPSPKALTAFCFLWAAAELFDLLCFPDWMLHPAGIGLFLAALSVLLKPSDLRRLLILCVLDAAYLWVKSPWTPNHFLFKGLVCLSILAAALRWRRQSEAVAEARDILRWELCALYLISFLHKLNWDFLAPDQSCAGFMLGGVAEQLPFVPTGGFLPVAAIWATLLIEGGVPVLLLIPRTRYLGLLVAWVFHFALSFHPRPGIYAFSAMMYALLSLFLPTAFYSHLETEIARHPRLDTLYRRMRSGDVRWMRPLLIGGTSLTVIVAVGLILSGVNLHGSNLGAWPRMVGMAIWVPYALLMAGALWVGRPGAASSERPRLFRDAFRSPALAVLALILLNGIAPYLGFQTVRVLSMFSNLRTEGGISNHLFIPAGWQVADYQTDLVSIVSSSDHVLQFYAEARQQIPFAEVRRRMWEPPAPAKVTFIRKGKTYSVNTSEPEAPKLVPPLGFLGRKILVFRGVNLNGPAECLW